MKRINKTLPNILKDLGVKNDLALDETDLIERPRQKIGFKNLNNHLNGFKCGDLIIIGSRPAMGKTSLALNLLSQICTETDKPALYFSNEMTNAEISMKLLTQHSQINSKNFRKKEFTEEDQRKIGKGILNLSSLKIYIEDSIDASLENVFKNCRELKENEGISLVVIDYLQLIKHVSSNSAHDISEILIRLKSLALELNCPIIILSQLSRKLENLQDKRPRLSHLRGSDEIESIANVVLLIYRDEIYNPNTDEPAIAEIIIAKNREGEIGTCKLKWVGKYQNFEDL